jgi:hypothetical protein
MYKVLHVFSSGSIIDCCTVAMTGRSGLYVSRRVGRLIESGHTALMGNKFVTVKRYGRNFYLRAVKP